MDALLKKLQYPGKGVAFVLDAPIEFQSTIDSWKNQDVPVSTNLSCTEVQFVLVFVTSKYQIQHWASVLAPLLQGDAICWMAYPKGSSRRYQTDFNRDSGWEPFGEIGFEVVRQVAIDHDWSALRFRKTSFIKSLTRSLSRTLSAEGRNRRIED